MLIQQGKTMKKLEKILDILEDFYPTHVMEDTYSNKPFLVLVSCILSLRTRDEITFPVSEKLFKIADTPEKMADIDLDELKSIIKSINYYSTKAENIQKFSREIVEKYNGKVPNTREKLMEFRGVGRKTANLVLAVGFKKHAIVVDTHVHRIANRLRVVNTKKPDDTEFALADILDKKYWRKINYLMVLHGREICKPITPKCEICPIKDYCQGE